MKKIIMVSMLTLTVLFTGCGKSKAEKKIEKQDAQELKEAEALMTLWGLEEDEIEEELELIKEEQKETKEERVKEEQKEEDMKFIEEEIRKVQEQAEAERTEYERIESEKREAEEKALKEKEDFMYGITSQQVSGLPCRIEWNSYCIKVYITDNETNLINSIVADVEDTRYTQIKQNLGLWSGEMKEKYSKQFNESPIVRYYYYAGEEWFGTAEDGFVLSDYLMY